MNIAPSPIPSPMYDYVIIKAPLRVHYNMRGVVETSIQHKRISVMHESKQVLELIYSDAWVYQQHLMEQMIHSTVHQVS